MIQLQTTYRKNGYDYRQLERIGDVAIFEQISEGNVIAYEVLEVQKQEAGFRYMQGQEIIIQAKELVPSTETWGKTAFTCTTLERAKYRAEYLQQRINDRVRFAASA